MGNERRLTFNQRTDLERLVKAGVEGIRFGNTNPTMNALQRKGFADYGPEPDGTFSLRPRWVATETGVERIRAGK
jgi:hypothetical protein